MSGVRPRSLCDGIQRRMSERSKTILAAKEQCATEEATKQFMLMPLGLLDNVFDPSEVVPEHLRISTINIKTVAIMRCSVMASPVSPRSQRAGSA